MDKGRDVPREYGEVELSGQRVRYSLRRSSRRTVGLTVDAAEGLVVHSPRRLSRAGLEQVLQGKARWILKKTAWAAGQRSHLRKVCWQPGHAFPYRGRHHPLALRLLPTPTEGGRASAPSLRVEGDTLTLTLPGTVQPGAAGLREQLLDAYREAAREEIALRLPLFADRLGVRPKQWRIKAQRRRWGSCSPRGILNFNWRLILAPPEVLDYVVVHELSHLHHPDHSHRFWAKVSGILPDHSSARQWLRLYGETLFIDEVPARNQDPAAFGLPPAPDGFRPDPAPWEAQPVPGNQSHDIQWPTSPMPDSPPGMESHGPVAGSSPPGAGRPSIEAAAEPPSMLPPGEGAPFLPTQTSLLESESPWNAVAGRGRTRRRVKRKPSPTSHGRQLELL